MSIVEAIGEGTVRLFSGRKRILGVLFLVAIAAATWWLFFYMSTEEKYWWHIEESKRLVDASKIYNKGFYASNNTETARINVEKMIELHNKARKHVLIASNLTNDPMKKKYAELLAESLYYLIKSDEKLLEIVERVEIGDEEGAKKAGRESHEFLRKADYTLLVANSYLKVILEGEGGKNEND